MAKNTSFKRLWTKTSVKRILKKFRNSPENFICIASSEFKSLWKVDDFRKEIIRKAETFKPEFYVDGTELDIEEVLFPGCQLNYKMTKVEFLEDQIKQLSTKHHELRVLTGKQNNF